jgi:hypothetical protein
MDKGTIVLAVQVCAELNIDNLKRETSGLFEAMKTFHLQEGVIVTPSQTDNFTNEGLMAKVMPFHWFAAEL